MPDRDVGPHRSLQLAGVEGERRLAGGRQRRLAVGEEPEVGGIPAHQHERRRNDEHRDDAAKDRVRRAPADGHDEMLRERRKHDAAGGDARRRRAERAPAPADEPARDRGVVRQAADARRAERDRAGETAVERRQRVRARHEHESHGQRRATRRLDEARPAPVDDPADGEPVRRRGDLQQRVPGGDGRAPAELRGERREERAPRVEDESGVDGVADERDRHDPPAVVEARRGGVRLAGSEALARRAHDASRSHARNDTSSHERRAVLAHPSWTHPTTAC